MPIKDKEKYNQYMNTYMKKKWQKRRSAAIELLGGKCNSCQSTTGLEFDHIIPEDKSFPVSKWSSASEKIWKQELSKCQLLCESCHLEKSRGEISLMKIALYRAVS